MKTITKAKLKTVLQKHLKYLRNEKGGVRAELVGYDLSYSDLRGSDLRGSDLSYSNLSYSDLSGSNLRGSDLSYSNLSYSNLSYSDLSSSDLRGSNLRGSNLSGVVLITHATTFLGGVLEILGACESGVWWVDQQDQSDFEALYNSASREDQLWLSGLLRGEPSALRLLHVFTFAVPL